jgi:glutamate-ammonia-ligase adenylyltransferase
VPSSLVQASYQHKLQCFLESCADSAWLQERLKEPLFAQQLELVWGCSDYVADQALANPGEFRHLVESGDLHRAYSDNEYQQALQLQVAALAIDDEEGLAKLLRGFRQRQMVRIIWRDFLRLSSLLQTTRELTLLAEACINVALDYLHLRLVRDLGTPMATNGDEQRLLVIAMGKMGAYELNISSDIDLIFAYPQTGETRGGPKVVSNQEFFNRLGQKLIAALDRQTVDGFVFRVDMRLRPYGQSGPLVQNFAALEEYYHAQGRGWERYALVKARVISGQKTPIQQLQNIVHPFVYRRYLDYGAIESLRDLKRQINLQVARKGMQDNIKLGAGGIREVEFITQTFQLIRGGRLKALQTQSLYEALECLVAEQLLPETDKSELWAAYEFLRNTEHVLQGMGDQQTQQLPIDPLAQQRVARVMGFDQWQDFLQQLDQHRGRVNKHFNEIIASDSIESRRADGGDRQPWHADSDPAEAVRLIKKLGYEQPDEVADALAQLYQSRTVLGLQTISRGRLDALMPMALKACALQRDADITFKRVLNLIQAILRRSAYLLLLIENPQALQQLALLCSKSSWISEQLTRYPALLDELLDARHLYGPLDKHQLRDQLRQQTLHLPYDDQEQHMEEIRYFCRSCTLRVAAGEITQTLTLMEVSDQLTWIAEAVVEHVTHIAWQQMASEYGVPTVPVAGSDNSDTPGFIVVAYGKMGGIEMGYQSDLDLVFLHENTANQTQEGDKSIDSTTFYTRLGRRIIHMLSTSTASGRAYEIDMRLRPSGNSGMLVSTLSGFAKYQQQDAWTWEHQALVRSRAITGDPETMARFDKIRTEQLCRSRDLPQLRTEVTEMRDKMRKHLNKTTNQDKYSLKQAPGGIVDIEFMVQFAVLAWSHQHHQLAMWSDTIRTLETMATCGVITEEQAKGLMDAYRAYRSQAHSLQLQNKPAEVLLPQFADHRKVVIDQWDAFFGD